MILMLLQRLIIKIGTRHLIPHLGGIKNLTILYNMGDLGRFLKVHSVIPNEFIDEFLSMTPDYPLVQTDFVIDLDIVAKWLSVRKDNLIRALRMNYKVDIDYVISKSTNKTGKYGGNHYKKVMLTPDCFKRLCMLSRSRKAEDVRSYYINLEALLIQYYKQTLDGMEQDIKNLEKSLQPKSSQKALQAGYIYVLKASHNSDSMYKIGRTKDLKKRLATYQTGKLEEVEVIYKFRTDNLKGVEDCVKLALKDVRPRKFKEIYKVDLNIIKQVISKCQQIEAIKQYTLARGPSTMTGGLYMALFPDD